MEPHPLNIQHRHIAASSPHRIFPFHIPHYLPCNYLLFGLARDGAGMLFCRRAALNLQGLGNGLIARLKRGTFCRCH